VARPKPLYSFFPIYSPFKLEDNDGFDLGEDNQIKSIFVQDDALRFELSAVLRPGRFLGNHYLAFTVPNRTFIITLERVKEGIRAARKMKQAAKALAQVSKGNGRSHRIAGKRVTTEEENRLRNGKPAPKRPPPRNFFSRFVDGYLQSERDDVKQERLVSAIKDFFGRQLLNVTKRDD
jgi:ZipA, C-terminal FtsZ-binding domain